MYTVVQYSLSHYALIRIGEILYATRENYPKFGIQTGPM